MKPQNKQFVVAVLHNSFTVAIRRKRNFQSRFGSMRAQPILATLPVDNFTMYPLQALLDVQMWRHVGHMRAIAFTARWPHR